MNRRTLSGRLSALPSAKRTAERQNYFRAGLEPLEDRKMLTVSTMLSNNWVDLSASGTGALSLGDSVADGPTGLVFTYGFDGFGIVTNATDSAHPANHFIIGSGNIHNAVLGTPDFGIMQISDGTYAGSDVLLGGAGHNHPITVFGDGALTKIVPEVASNHSDVSNLGVAGNGASGAHMAFIINALSTTVSGLTIDGNLGGVGGSMNYQQGVATFYDISQNGNTGANTTQSYSDLTIGNTVQNYTDLAIGNQHSYTDLTIGNDQSYTDLAIGNHKTYTDIHVDPNDATKISSAANPFQPGDALANLTITGGLGFTLQTVHIVSVDATTHVATIAPATGTLGATGGQGFSDSDSKAVTSAAHPFNAASVGSTLNITTSSTVTTYSDLVIGNDHNLTDLVLGNQHSYTDLVVDPQDNTKVTSSSVPFTAGDVNSIVTITSSPTLHTYTDLSINAVDNTKVTSIANPFAPSDVGSSLQITGGSGFTVQTVQILAVNGSTATVSAPLGTVNSTGGTGVDKAFLNGNYQILQVAGNVAKLDQIVGAVGSTGGVGTAVGNNREIKSAANPFSVGDVGASITITGGSGFTPGSYTISTVQGNVAVLNVAAGTIGSTGGLATYANVKQLTSAASPFNANDVGATLVLNAGSGFTGGTYTVTSVNGAVATVNASLGTNASTGGTGSKKGFTVQSVQITSVTGVVATVSASLGVNDSTGGVGTSFNVKQVTSAAVPFQAGDAGSTLTITSGTGFTPGVYTIASVANNVATLNVSPGLDSSTGGVATADGGTSKVTSAAHPFGPTDVGLILRVTGGPNFTVQNVTISAVNGTVATLSAAAGTDGATGGLASSNGGNLHLTSAAHPFQVSDIGLSLTVTGGATITSYSDLVIGNDHSYTDLKIGNQHTYTDLVINGTNNKQVTSAAVPFTSGDVGSTLTITSGAGFTPGTYTIASVSGNVATVNLALGTVGSTGGNGSANGGNLEVTSAANPFDASQVGSTLHVTGGSGFTVQNVTITAVNSGVATVSAALGTNGSTGGIATSFNTTQVTSAGHPFGSGSYDPLTNPNGSVGLTLRITAGSGFAAGNYVINAVSNNVATLSAVVGTDSSTGGVATTEGFRLQTYSIVTVDPATHVATVNTALGDLGTTGGLGTVNAAFYAAYDWLDAQNGNPVTAIQVPLDPAPFGPGNPEVHMTATNLTVNNTWVHGIAMSAFYQTGTYKYMAITNNSVNNVGAVADRATDLNRDGILMMNMDNGFVGGNTVTGVGVGVMTTYYGATPTFGNIGGPAAHAQVAVNTVTDAVQRAFSITNNHGDNEYGSFVKNVATFSNPSNTAIGVYWDHSETFIVADTITGAQTGIKIVNTTFDLQSGTGRQVAPLIYANTLITGPSGSHPSAVGIDMTTGQTAAMVGEATITGYPVGISVGQSPVVASKTFTDLIINGSNNLLISSAANPFSAADVGTILNITGGTGFTVQSVRIQAVDGTTHVATVRDVNTNDGTTENGVVVAKVVGFTGAGTVGSIGGVGAISHASILVLAGAHISSDTVGISAGDNSQILGGGPNVTSPITATGSAVINPSWIAGQVLGSNTFSIGDQRILTTIVPNTAEIMASGNLTLSSTSTFTPLLTGQNAAPTTLFNFNAVPLGADDLPVAGGIYPDQAADQPLAVPPATSGPPYETDTWGGTFLGFWHADMVQNGSGQLVIAGTAVNGSGSAYLFGTKGHTDPNNVGYPAGTGDAPLRILDPVDLSNTTQIQVVIKPLSDNQAPNFGIGIIDERGNANLFTFQTPSSTATFTTLTLNLLDPSADLIGPDNSVDLKHIAGFVIGADQSTLSGMSVSDGQEVLMSPVTNIPFRFSLDNIAFTSVPNSQIDVHSTVTLAGTLSPQVANGFTPTVGQSFVIIKNNTGSAVTGAFSNAPDGGFLSLGGLKYQVSYQGNSEHDVTLTRVADLNPVVDPNGSDAGTFTSTWSGTAVAAVGSTNDSHGATVTDADDPNLASFTASIASPAAHDVLNATASGSVTISGNGTNTLVLTGGANTGEYQAVLRTLTYHNTTGDEGAGPKTINFTAVDPFGVTGVNSSVIVIAPPPSGSVTNRFLFYKSSGYDKTSTALPFTPLAFSDDNAIATDKIAYLPGTGAATFNNLSSYNLGINGIMIDLKGSGSHNLIDGTDFVFKSGNTATVDGTWSTLSGAALPTVSTRLGMTGSAQGAGTVSGSDRVELIWASGTAVTQKWLEVTVKATAHTGLTADDHFFFGSSIGNANKSNLSTIFKVGGADTTGAQTHLATVGTNQPITNVFDYNRDGSVGGVDITQDQIHPTTNVTGTIVINIAGGGPFAALPPSGDDGSSSEDGAVASGLASSSASSASSSASVPAWLANRLSHLDLNHGPIAQYFEHLAQEDTARDRAILVKADQLADSLGLDDSLLDSLVGQS